MADDGKTPEELAAEAAAAESRTAAKGLIRETLDEWFEEHKPNPKRTEKPKSSLLNDLFGI